ncbi:MAG: formamidopyrimidine-DNA glycosylase [Gammaproteobacteria bacterium]|nr:formamidopyrimidine-DNA glycosylase [Gammaproteobacteria bacterium]MCP5198716.1 formamidopyrimidine-DNA glycosylase [Gammaproteobacteria bacterium]
MPELPDITLYCEALDTRVTGTRLDTIEIRDPFVLRTAEPAVDTCSGRRVAGVRRVGKRIALGLEGGLWLVVHLMVAGRLAWIEAGRRARGGKALARFEFERGTLVLSEAGSKRRASLHVVAGAEGWRQHDPGGLEIPGSSRAAFAARLTASNHTLKRALTDPRIVSGIGNAYSDEILHAARLSPVTLTQKLTAAEITRLHDAAQGVLAAWTERLRSACGDDFPARVTAFRDGMAVHGRYGQPCPDCGTRVQRIRYADAELNYCPRCQCGGRLYADRALSRLLHRDWPRTIEALEAQKPP